MNLFIANKKRMKLIELEINNIRGIKHLILKPEQENIVIYGPNGAGKSAVVDAIDCLLTGKISRLIGQGTKGVSLKNHGSHIDIHDPEKVVISAKIKIPEVQEEIIITRSLKKPDNLKYNKKYEGYIEPFLTVAERGQYVLTRKEILKFIAAEPGKRSEEIQALLNIVKIENIRKNLVKVKNQNEKKYDVDKSCVERDENAIMTTVGIAEFNSDTIKRFINHNRKILNLTETDDVMVSNILEGLDPLKQEKEKKRINPEILTKYIDQIKKHKEDNGKELLLAHTELLKKIKTLKEDQD
jgi:DNA repair exonuclease SbcCD ATPase subunit